VAIVAGRVRGFLSVFHPLSPSLQLPTSMICLQCRRALLPDDGGMGSVMDEWKRRARASMSLPSESSFAIDRMQRLLLPGSENGLHDLTAGCFRKPCPLWIDRGGCSCRTLQPTPETSLSLAKPTTYTTVIRIPDPPFFHHRYSHLALAGHDNLVPISVSHS